LESITDVFAFGTFLATMLLVDWRLGNCPAVIDAVDIGFIGILDIGLVDVDL